MTTLSFQFKTYVYLPVSDEPFVAEGTYTTAESGFDSWYADIEVSSFTDSGGIERPEVYDDFEEDVLIQIERG